ncbi:MAG: MMPL family transporter [Deltaproteobacteria bacterium]|nr:MMPL family transporter [Deltaproteobacteria bacterium]
MSLGKQIQEGLFNRLWRLVSTHTKAVIGVGVILAILSGLVSFLFLRLNSDQDKLVSPKTPFHKRYLAHLKNFGDQEYLYIVIKTGGTAEGKKKAIQFAEDLNRRLRQYPKLIQAVYFRISPADLGGGVLLFASPQEAKTLYGTIRFLAPFMDAWIRDGSLSGFIDTVAKLLGGEGGDLPEVDPAVIGQALGALKGLLENMNGIMAGKAAYRSVLDLSQAENDYFFTSSGKLLIMRLLPDKDFGTMDVIGKPLQAVRHALDATLADYPDIEAGLTGRPVLQADEMETTDRDMTKAALIAMVLVALLFMVILHGWLRPLLLLISLIMAMAWSFGFATVAVGELNLLSIVFALVLVGIGVDFGVHIIMRYVEATKEGAGVEAAVQISIFRTGPGIILGAVTSVCAFYSVLWSDFIGLAELGMIGGTGVLLCLVSMMTVLPAMLLIAGRRNLFPSSVPSITALPFLERLSKRPGWAILVLFVITLAGLPGIFKVGFNYNLLELQAKGLESVEYEKTLIDASDESTWYAILTADNLKDVERLTRNLETLPSVGKVESILDFIPKNQARKSAIYEKAARELEPLSFDALPSPVPDAHRLIGSLSRLSLALEGLEEKLFAAGAGSEIALIEQDLAIIASATELLKQVPKRAERLKALQLGLARDMDKSIRQLKVWLSAGSVTPDDLPTSLRDLYVGKDGSYQIKVIPKGDVWDFGTLAHFVSQLRRVDPEVSGVPVGVLESAWLMHRTFLLAAGLTIVLVTLILWLYWRSLRVVFLTVLPLGVSIIWLLEIMGWLGLNFNLANFFAIPILIAIGVDGGVHLLARWGELQFSAGGEFTDRNGLFHTSTPTAVALSFATTMIGFGGLLFAHHRGLASLGWVMVLGSLMGMLASLLVLPPALKLMRRR